MVDKMVDVDVPLTMNWRAVNISKHKAQGCCRCLAEALTGTPGAPITNPPAGVFLLAHPEDWFNPPKKPKVKIIKFSRLDQLDDTTHIHGMSFGINNDDLIEIYINPSSWESFNKPMRYMLMYHELAHDLLNLEDLAPTGSNNEKFLMYPHMSDFRNLTMDEFIESYQKVFLEYSLTNTADIIARLGCSSAPRQL